MVALHVASNIPALDRSEAIRAVPAQARRSRTLQPTAGVLAVFAIMATAVMAGATHAQSYPTKPVRYVMPFAAGGPSDVFGRALARELSADLGQPVVVENRPGATGVIGLNMVTNSPPDGYTLLQFSNTTAVAHYFQGKPFDIDRQMTTIGNFHLGMQMLIVNPDVVNVRTLPELIEHIRSHPGMNYTSSGQGSPGNLLVESMALSQRLKTTHVGYNGVGPAITDVIAGRVGMIVTDGVASKPHLDSGRLRAIVVVASQRSSMLPAVPTSAEQGHADLKNDSLSGVVGPPGMPQPVVDRLRAGVRRAAASESYRAFEASTGNLNKFIDGPEFRSALIEDYQRWGKVIREAGIKGE